MLEDYFIDVMELKIHIQKFSWDAFIVDANYFIKVSIKDGNLICYETIRLLYLHNKGCRGSRQITAHSELGSLSNSSLNNIHVITTFNT